MGSSTPQRRWLALAGLLVGLGAAALLWIWLRAGASGEQSFFATPDEEVVPGVKGTPQALAPPETTREGLASPEPGLAMDESAESEAAPTVGLHLLFTSPDGNEVAPTAATVHLSNVGWSSDAPVSGASALFVPEVPAVPIRAQVDAPDFRHWAQHFDLSVPEPEGRTTDSNLWPEPFFQENVVLWPKGWVPVIVLTTDGKPFDVLVEQFGMEPKNLLYLAFQVWVHREPPELQTRFHGGRKPAKFRGPPGYPSWQLPGSIVGSLQVLEPVSFWAGLSLFGRSLEWAHVPVGAEELVFRVDAEDFEASFAKVDLRVVDDVHSPVAGARVTLKADTSPHRRSGQSKVPSGPDGRVHFDRVVPGRYELLVEGDCSLQQDRFELEPGDSRDWGDVQLIERGSMPLRVVDADGTPAWAFIEVGPYRRGASHKDLYPPNLHRLTDQEGSYELCLPSAVSILRATRAVLPPMQATNESSTSVLLDPSAPLGSLKLVLRKPVEVTFDVRHDQAAAIVVWDALGLIAWMHVLGGEAAPPCELIPGDYRGRLLDNEASLLGEVPFTVRDERLQVRLP
jgi:hypothetical protein